MIECVVVLGTCIHTATIKVQKQGRVADCHGLDLIKYHRWQNHPAFVKPATQYFVNEANKEKFFSGDYLNCQIFHLYFSQKLCIAVDRTQRNIINWKENRNMTSVKQSVFSWMEQQMLTFWWTCSVTTGTECFFALKARN